MPKGERLTGHALFSILSFGEKYLEMPERILCLINVRGAIFSTALYVKYLRVISTLEQIMQRKNAVGRLVTILHLLHPAVRFRAG